MSFLEILNQYAYPGVRDQIEAATGSDVERALSREHPDVRDLAALLSPAAASYLEPLARKAHSLTVQRFGRNILLYAPLYLSNLCSNGCRYCGFSAENRLARRTLNPAEIQREARILYDQGFRHVLLLTGEAPESVDDAFIAAAVRQVKPLFSSIGIEVYPMEVAAYRQMVEAGVDALTLYQETYDRELYAELHPFGRKRDFDWRLAGPERGGAAGLRRIGIGSLLGLGDWRTEGFFTALHGLYLGKHFWRSQLTIGLPRIRPADGGFQPLHPVSDPQMVQLICALRLLLPDAGLVLSTRESAALRDNLIPLGITQMSAGSCTAPGGYGEAEEGGRQFAIDDERSPETVAATIRAQGYEAVWKDWDAAFLSRAF